MKFNLKNLKQLLQARNDYLAEWFDGFEKELRRDMAIYEKLKLNQKWGRDCRKLIVKQYKEILGETKK